MSKDEMINDLFEENKRLKNLIAELQKATDQVRVTTPRGELLAVDGSNDVFPEIAVDVDDEPAVLIGWDPEIEKLLIRVWDQDHEDWRVAMNYETGEVYAEPDVALQPLKKLFPY